jgi:hypothetical protein
MAAIAGAPLVHVFNLRERGWHYHFFGFPPQRPVLPAREERDAYLHDSAARFAADLESVLKRDPLQWYNFYPFWDKSEGSSGAREKANIDEVDNSHKVSLSASDLDKDNSVATSGTIDSRQGATLATTATLKRSG